MSSGGQPVKSRELFWLLQKEYGPEAVKYIDTGKWKRHPLTTFLKVMFLSIRSDAIIMLPAHNGVKVFSRILCFVKKRFKKHIFYDVIGGWLVELLKENPKLIVNLSRFDCVFVETSTMKSGLDKMNIPCRVVPNFRRFEPLLESSLDLVIKKPLRLCIFSRITEMKGITDAIEVVRSINIGRTFYTLDIYGPIDPLYEERFKQLRESFPAFIKYKGCVSPTNSVSVLKDYFALLFPTKFYTEGIPGTVVDAFFSGLPVISSKWLSFSDVINDGRTGIGFEFNNFNDLREKLIEIYKKPQIIINMKSTCINESKLYTAQHALSLLKEEFEIKRI